MSYGREMVLDIVECDISRFTRTGLTEFFVKLCELIEMEREDLHFWDYHDDPEAYKDAPDHLKGTSAVQFIKTSNITVHTLDAHRTILINIFSCKFFNSKLTEKFCLEFFGGKLDDDGSGMFQRAHSIESIEDLSHCRRCKNPITPEDRYRAIGHISGEVFPVCGTCSDAIHSETSQGD